MKNINQIIIILFGSFFFYSSGAVAQDKGSETSLNRLEKKFSEMAKSNDPVTLISLKKELYKQLKGKDEQDYLLACRFFYKTIK